jgi:hypothetical protein
MTVILDDSSAEASTLASLMLEFLFSNVVDAAAHSFANFAQ